MLVPYLNNSSEETIFESNNIKEKDEAMKLQNEVHWKPWLLMDWNRPTVHKVEKKSYKLYYSSYTNIDKVKIFCVLHDKVALLRKRCSERGTRNRHQRIFRKVLNHVRKGWSKDDFFMTLKLILDFPFADLSQHLRIYLVIFALKYFIHGHE